MTIEKAVKNISIVTGNARMTRDEHAALDESLRTLVNRIQALEKQPPILIEKLEENKDE